MPNSPEPISAHFVSSVPRTNASKNRRRIRDVDLGHSVGSQNAAPLTQGLAQVSWTNVLEDVDRQNGMDGAGFERKVPDRAHELQVSRTGIEIDVDVTRRRVRSATELDAKRIDAASLQIENAAEPARQPARPACAAGRDAAPDWTALI
jgi:hypothetical protein